MRLHVPALAPGRLTVAGAGHHHLARVLRARAGSPVVLFDGAGGEADAVVVSVDEHALVLEVSAPRRAPLPVPDVTLLLGLLKGEKMDLVVQKATELGVARLVPLQTARSVVRLDEKRAAPRRERWQKIAREAARQCGRADVPEVAAATPVADALAAAAGGLRVLLHESASDPLGPLLGDRPPAVVVAVGPEGGFAPDEVAAARAAGFAVAGLGPRILRAETAALAALCIVFHAAGDLGGV